MSRCLQLLPRPKLGEHLSHLLMPFGLAIAHRTRALGFHSSQAAAMLMPLCVQYKRAIALCTPCFLDALSTLLHMLVKPAHVFVVN